MTERILPKDPRSENRRADDRRSSDRRKSDRRVGQRGRRKNDRNSIKTLLFLCVAALLGLGAFIIFETNVGSAIDWRKMFLMKEKEKTAFKLGNVSLGMSRERVKKQHPNLDFANLGRGESVTSFNFEGAHFTVWFININGSDKAFRMRYDQSYRTRTEAEVLESIGKIHGKPGTSECARAGDQERKCHFQWWPSGGTALSVSTIEIKSNQKAVRTDVTMIATDTYLDGKRLRLQSKPGAAKIKTEQKKSSEKLPF
jgi:hypothetical protein